MAKIRKLTLDVNDLEGLIEAVLALAGPVGLGARAIIALWKSWRNSNQEGQVTDFVKYVRETLIEPAGRDQSFAQEWLADHGYTRDDNGEWVPPAEA